MYTINDLVYDINAKFIKKSDELEFELENKLSILKELVPDTRLAHIIEDNLNTEYNKKLENLTAIYNIALSTLYAMK